MNTAKPNLTEQNSRFSNDDQLKNMFEAETDRFSNELLENVKSTPIGRLLGLISTLPEIRQQKVDDTRLRISDEGYVIEEGLDLALDRVLEELLTENY